MNLGNILGEILKLLVYIVLQVFFLRNNSLFGYAFCFIYVGYLLLIPTKTNRILYMLAAMGLGFVVDLFYNTYGIHTAAALLMAYLRHYVLMLPAFKSAYENVEVPLVKNIGLNWFLYYAGALVFAHHLALFMIEASYAGLLLRAVGLSFSSSLFTVAVMVIFQYLFYAPRRR